MLKAKEISEVIKQRILQFDVAPRVATVGIILSIRDGIVEIFGLKDVMQGEMLAFPGDVYGVALNLEQDVTSAIVFGDSTHLQEGQEVKGTQRMLTVPVGVELLGRVVNALGIPLDNCGKLLNKEFLPVETEAPGIVDRKSVAEPLHTGIKAIDAMIPLGRGQRELIIGDRQTGKTTIALDTIINQKDTGVKCIYVSIGQKMSSVANIKQRLDEYGALSYTTIVAATAADLAAEQYIAAYAGCAIGEYFRNRGEDALIIYDDLTKHAWAYRQISLLLRRPPGREAYPGDIFYLHSRLLERASRVNESYVEHATQGAVKNHTGSLTALPIVETQAGDLSAFIPTNVISITDGQLFLEADLFNEGIRPAINVGLSVSRVGGAAQTEIIKKLGSGLRLALAQYRELEAFSQFASELDEATRKQLERGQHAVEILKQPAHQPLSVAYIALSLFIVEHNILQDIAKNKVTEFEQYLQKYFQEQHPDIITQINHHPVLTEELTQKLLKIIKNVHAEFVELK